MPGWAERGRTTICLVAEATDESTALAALASAEAMLAAGAAERGSGAGLGLHLGAVLARCAGASADLNLALISVPGEYAAAEARRALRAGLT